MSGYSGTILAVPDTTGVKYKQERSIEKNTTLIMMYSIIAVMIMIITYTARLTPDAPCSLLLGEAE
jgi:hypothetical protein